MKDPIADMEKLGNDLLDVSGEAKSVDEIAACMISGTLWRVGAQICERLDVIIDTIGRKQ